MSVGVSFFHSQRFIDECCLNINTNDLLTRYLIDGYLSKSSQRLRKGGVWKGGCMVMICDYKSNFCDVCGIDIFSKIQFVQKVLKSSP